VTVYGSNLNSVAEPRITLTVIITRFYNDTDSTLQVMTDVVSFCKFHQCCLLGNDLHHHKVFDILYVYDSLSVPLMSRPMALYKYAYYVRQVNGVKLADIMFSLFCACLCVCQCALSPIGLNGWNAEKCIRLMHEKLIIFPYGQYIVRNVVLLASDDIVRFKIEIGVEEKCTKM